MKHMATAGNGSRPAIIGHEIGCDDLEAPIRVDARRCQPGAQTGLPLRRTQRGANLMPRSQQGKDAMAGKEAGAARDEDRAAVHVRNSIHSSFGKKVPALSLSMVGTARESLRPP